MRTVKESNAGTMYTTTLDGITCYDIFTKSGFYRGGKIYFADKIVRILSGEAVLYLEEEGVDVIKKLFPESGESMIPGGIPNLFYFPKDTRMLEWFPEGTQSEDYQRYREMKK